jgi:hypothetical protein
VAKKGTGSDQGRGKRGGERREGEERERREREECCGESSLQPYLFAKNDRFWAKLPGFL